MMENLVVDEANFMFGLLEYQATVTELECAQGDTKRHALQKWGLKS